MNTSEGALKVAIHRLRKRYREIFRQEIADTVANPAEVESELRFLAAVLTITKRPGLGMPSGTFRCGNPLGQIIAFASTWIPNRTQLWKSLLSVAGFSATSREHSST
jgi:hypothetical protein